MICLKLFWSFLRVGLFSIGGGYAALPIIQKEIVESNSWLTTAEFVDVLTISQMTPGPIAINAATFVGIRVGGVWGAIASTVGCIAAPCIIALIMAYFYYKYMDLWVIRGILTGLRPAVVALIASAALMIVSMSLFSGKQESVFSLNIATMDIKAVVLFIAGIFALRIFKINTMYFILGIGLISLM